MGFAKYNEDEYEIMRERIEAMERRKNAAKRTDSDRTDVNTARFNFHNNEKMLWRG